MLHLTKSVNNHWALWENCFCFIDEIESISGSESESEDDQDKSETSVPIRHAKVFFKNKKGEVISVYRCLLFSNKVVITVMCS